MLYSIIFFMWIHSCIEQCLIRSALQSTVVEEEEDGVIYTVVVKQHNVAPNSLLVRHTYCD